MFPVSISYMSTTTVIYLYSNVVCSSYTCCGRESYIAIYEVTSVMQTYPECKHCFSAIFIESE